MGGWLKQIVVEFCLPLTRCILHKFYSVSLSLSLSVCLSLSLSVCLPLSLNLSLSFLVIPKLLSSQRGRPLFEIAQRIALFLSRAARRTAVVHLVRVLQKQREDDRNNSSSSSNNNHHGNQHQQHYQQQQQSQQGVDGHDDADANGSAFTRDGSSDHYDNEAAERHEEDEKLTGMFSVRASGKRL